MSDRGYRVDKVVAQSESRRDSKTANHTRRAVPYSGDTAIPGAWDSVFLPVP